MSENASVGRDFPVDMNWRFIYQSPNWHVRFHPPLTFGYYLCNLRKRLFSSIANTDIISYTHCDKPHLVVLPDQQFQCVTSNEARKWEHVVLTILGCTKKATGLSENLCLVWSNPTVIKSRNMLWMGGNVVYWIGISSL